MLRQATHWVIRVGRRPCRCPWTSADRLSGPTREAASFRIGRHAIVAAEEPLVTGCALRGTLEEQLLAAFSPSFLPICRNAFSQLSGQRRDNQVPVAAHGMSTCTPSDMLSCRQVGVRSKKQKRRVSNLRVRQGRSTTCRRRDRSTRLLVDMTEY